MSKIVHQQDIIERQILAMGIARFDVATRKKSGSTLDHDGLYLTQLWGLVDLLREQNQAGQAVLIRPHGEHGMTLLSGLDNARLSKLRVEGFEPALVVQYGKDLFQAWLKHDRKLDQATSEKVAKCLAEIAGVDASTAHWDSYGYLANFLIPAWVQGEAQEAWLVEDTGKVYSAAPELLSKYCTTAG
ncbi:MAG: DNA-primase RepB domain-containing protein [Pseudomonadota bacterium]